jgi:ring-1,2-phenylacetyl-CoA epoxidase subunit PaaC
MARQFFFDSWHFLLLQQLAQSSDSRIAEIAAKALKEVSYHLERSQEWILRLGDGTAESHRRVQNAIDDLWMYTGECFEADEVDREVVERRLGPDPSALHGPWLRRVQSTTEEATLRLPASDWMQRGGKRGTHSEHLGYILAEMQFLQRAYPGATW